MGQRMLEETKLRVIPHKEVKALLTRRGDVVVGFGAGFPRGPPSPAFSKNSFLQFESTYGSALTRIRSPGEIEGYLTEVDEIRSPIQGLSNFRSDRFLSLRHSFDHREWLLSYIELDAIASLTYL